jgi:hypothetical protein
MVVAVWWGTRCGGAGDVVADAWAREGALTYHVGQSWVLDLELTINARAIVSTNFEITSVLEMDGRHAIVDILLLLACSPYCCQTTTANSAAITYSKSMQQMAGCRMQPVRWFV